MPNKRMILAHQFMALLPEIRADFQRGLKPAYDWIQIVGASDIEFIRNKQPQSV